MATSYSASKLSQVYLANFQKLYKLKPKPVICLWGGLGRILILVKFKKPKAHSNLWSKTPHYLHLKIDSKTPLYSPGQHCQAGHL